MARIRKARDAKTIRAGINRGRLELQVVELRGHPTDDMIYAQGRNRFPSDLYSEALYRTYRKGFPAALNAWTANLFLAMDTDEE